MGSIPTIRSNTHTTRIREPIKSRTGIVKTLKIAPERTDVLQLLRRLDEYMTNRYPAESNHLDSVEELSKPNVYFVGAFMSQTLVGIGAVKALSDDGTYGEIKRVFVSEDRRGKGVSKLIMSALETHLLASGINISRLETGVRQPEAVRLYASLGYRQRGPFGCYEPDVLSLFMEKVLSP